MKIEDCYIGQPVGFTYSGEKLIGEITDLQVEVVEGKAINLATVETDETMLEVNVGRLLGVVK